MKIKENLILGDAGEKRVIKIYDYLGFSSYQRSLQKKFLYWDIETFHDDGSFTTEVKWDIYSAKSGNLAIEIYNTKSNKPSGLHITRADLWAHMTNRVYITSVRKLKHFINKHNPKKVIIAGDNGNAMLLLYPMKQILPIFLDVEKMNIPTAKRKILKLVGYF